MKKTILFFALIYSSLGSYSQNTFPSTGNVGIGTSSPLSLLDVKGNIQISNADIPMGLMTEVLGTTPLLNMSVNFREVNKNLNYMGGGFRIDTRGTEYPLFQWLCRNPNTTSERLLMVIDSSGNLGVGTGVPREKLSVNGNIRAKDVIVETINWPDYVFKPTYKLPDLKDVKTYIDQNQHLPEMPSEKDIAEKGLNLGELNKLLTKKVEELTIYLIEKDKQLNKQQIQINHIMKTLKRSHR